MKMVERETSNWLFSSISLLMIEQKAFLTLLTLIFNTFSSFNVRCDLSSSQQISILISVSMQFTVLIEFTIECMWSVSNIVSNMLAV